MSCSACTIHRGNFPSEERYADFRIRLAESVARGDLTKIGDEDPTGPFVKVRYKCNRCGSCWLLSVPDQAFRGGWREIQCK